MSYPRIPAGKHVLKRGPTTTKKNSGPHPPSPQPNAKEITLQTKRRMEKAERDERVDITKALTPVKTYMGGFTRPQDLRISNWWPGGAYLAKGKVYEAPPPAAYEPHTVFLLEARYPTRHGVGRQDSIEYVVGVCREGDLPAVLDKYNSWNCPKEQKEIMDNAVWPWVEPKRKKTVVWWDKGESKTDTLRRRREEIYGDSSPTQDVSAAPVDLASAPSPPAGVPHQARAYHSSVPRSSDMDKSHTTPSERAEIPTSSWSRPHKPSQDADDNVVPAYYIERRRQLDDIAERKEAEGGLMAQLSAGILSEGIAAETRPREEKIPPEVIEEDGTVRLPSGFEPPTPATEFHPVAAFPPLDTDEPLVKPGNATWEEVLAPAEGDEVTALGSSSAQGASGTRGFHTSAVARAREVPLPNIETSNPSVEASAVAAPAVDAPAKRAQAPFKLQPGKKGAEAEDEYLYEGEDPVEEVNTPILPVADSVRDFNTKLQEYRERYMAQLKEKPYWRPLLTATLSTRSLALTYARLSRALPRGLAFYASIEEADRKYAPTFNSRIRQLRVRRMRQLIIDIGRRLRGDCGGFPGIRFSPTDRGRTLGGEGLAAPIPPEKRVIHVGIGTWHLQGEQLRELMQEEIDELDLGDGFNVFGLDEFGRRSDGVEWARPKKPITAKALDAALSEDLSHLKPAERKKRLLEITQERGRQIAYALAQKNRKVEYPLDLKSASLDEFTDVPPPAESTKAQ